ncbi:MAG: glycoside hydrolase family 3 C-terminal domain-containing protein [Pyrinomonadaceae bacterium]
MGRVIGAACLVVILTWCSLPARAVRGQSPPPRLGQSSVKEVVAALTLEEKASLLVGMGADWTIPNFQTMTPEDKAIPEKVPGAAGRTHSVPRLGIPSLTLSDGPAGVRIDPTRKNDPSKTYYATAFPVATLLASSWDAGLVQRVGAAFGEEAREYGVDVLLAPGMDIHRNPLGGRNFEYYSEDPLVTGRMAAAFVKGVQSRGVGTSIKHFAANEQEFNRMQSDSVVSERALREVYLKGFEVAVQESQPWTVMSSYNLINGTYTSESRELLTNVLRDDWGFQGLVMTDWWAGNDAVSQLKAGNDLLMPGTPYQAKDIVEAVRAGTLSRQQLDENVERFLNLVMRSPAFKGYRYSDRPDLKAHALLAREAAAEGMVLLRNEGNALPLAAPKRVALYGNTSYELFAGGSGSGDVNEAYTVSLEQGLADAGFSLDAPLKEAYEHYLADYNAKHPRPKVSFFLPPPIPELTVETSAVGRSAAEADTALITVGRNAGEGGDRKVEGDFTLSETERALIKTVADAFHAKGKKVFVVLNVGGPVEVASWRDGVDSILLAWQPGQEGGRAIADVLGGRINPSGKLATTFPVRYEDVPSAKVYPGKELPGRSQLTRFPYAGRPSEALYEEGIFVGYRYYETFDLKPAYAFGHGLSYTSFTYGGLKLSSKQFGGKLTATLTVINTGKVAGREVVQLYLSAPSRKLAKPSAELKGFAKTGLLSPGQSQTVSFDLGAADLASFDPAASAWVAEAGTYTLKVGASSADIRQAGTFELKRETIAGKTSRALIPKAPVREIKPQPGR